MSPQGGNGELLRIEAISEAGRNAVALLVQKIFRGNHMARILYPVAKFGRGKDKQKRKRKSIYSGVNEAFSSNQSRTGLKVGLAAGTAAMLPTIARQAKGLKGFGKLNFTQKLAAINAPLSSISKASRIGLAGAVLGAGAYGVKKALDSRQQKSRRKF